MIEVKDLTKYYDHLLAVEKLSFEIKRGEIVGFLGPNGAGKTTTLRMVTGYLPPTSGKCTVAGWDIDEHPIEAKRRIGYLPETNPLYEEMEVTDYLRFVASLREIESTSKRMREVVDICGLQGVIGRPIGELSRGYKQRVGLAQAIIHNPDILIMDEPTEGLDPNQVVEVRGLIKELGKEKTVIVSTHILSEVEATCDRVLIINKGKIVADGSRGELQQMTKGKEVLSLVAKGPKEAILEAIRSYEGVEKVEVKSEEEGVIGYEIEGWKDLREEIFNLAVNRRWTILELHRKIASLEDIFRELTR